MRKSIFVSLLLAVLVQPVLAAPESGQKAAPAPNGIQLPQHPITSGDSSAAPAAGAGAAGALGGTDATAAAAAQAQAAAAAQAAGGQ